MISLSPATVLISFVAALRGGHLAPSFLKAHSPLCAAARDRPSEEWPPALEVRGVRPMMRATLAYSTLLHLALNKEASCSEVMHIGKWFLKDMNEKAIYSRIHEL